jgi:Tol biopolymer transport system component
VLPDRSSIVYVPSATDGRAHLVFLREGALMAQPFDVVNLQAVGDPFAVSRQALFSASPPQVAASASTDGTLVYLAGTDDTQLTWFDRNGKTIGVAGAPTTRQYAVTLSPDGHSVTTIRSTPAGPSELWLRDQVRGSVSRVATAGLTPIWAPDSSRIWFRTTVDNRQGLFQYELRSGVLDFIQAAGPELPQCRMSDWSRDGRFVICTRDDPKSGADIWSVPVESGKLDFKNAAQLVGSGATEGQGQLSPDRKWLAYTSNETGEEHVHVRSFPSGSSVFKVSVTSAMEPRWRSDGKELFFLTGTVGPVRLMSVSVGSGADGTLSLGEPQKLFDTNVRLSTIESNSWSYSPHPDGQRFLFNVMPDGRIPTVTVITRWLLPIANVSEH